MAILCALLGLQLHLYLIKARENFSLDFHQAAWNCLVIQDLHTYFLLFRPKYLFWLPKGRKQRTLMRTHWKPWQSNFTLKLKHLWMLRTSVIFGMILAVLSTIRRSWTLTHSLCWTNKPVHNDITGSHSNYTVNIHQNHAMPWKQRYPETIVMCDYGHGFL